ncbi:MAG: hypothetical protein C0497_13590 [Gemmatimonas sp.]|nr:hypothetical protein [Gemmatimonas sp.]
MGYLISRGTEQTKSAQVPEVSAADTGVTVELLPPGDSTTRAASDTSERAASAAVAPIPASVPTTARAALPAAPRAASSANSAKIASSNPAARRPAPLPIVADTGPWEYATANTWVRVRSAPTRESDVLRTVDSAQRVRLGPPMNGWRPIGVGADRGWVDSHFFTVVRAPRP